MPLKITVSKSPTGATRNSDCQIQMDSGVKARRNEEDLKHTEALVATKKKLYLSEVAGVASTESFTAATLLYNSDDVRTPEACRDAVVAAKQWTKSAKAALKASQ